MNEYVGGYSDWQKQLRKENENRSEPINDAPIKKPLQKPPSKKNTKRLGFNERQELDDIPDRIEALERELEELTVQMGAADFYSQDGDVIKLAGQRLSELNEELEAVYLRWEVLSERDESTE